MSGNQRELNFTFHLGETPQKAVKNSIALEMCSKMALMTYQINPEVTQIPEHILKLHYTRKHGSNAYYGQNR